MRKAISLYELIIVMSIIAIVVGITIPTIRSYLPSLKLSSSAKSVSTKLRQAQEEAVTTQNSHGIKFNLTTPPTPPTIELIDNSGATLETVTLSNGITMSLTDITDNKVMFSPDGGLSIGSAPGTITVALLDPAASKTITVTAAGVIKLQ